MSFRILLLALFPLVGFAQNYGVRTTTLGSASTCLNDVWSSFNNPSALAFTNGMNAGVNYENRFLLRQLSERSLAASMQVKKQAIGIGASQFGYNSFNLFESRLSYARLLSQHFSLGVSFNYWQLHIGDIYKSKRTFTGAVSFTWKSTDKLQWGFVLNNPTSNQLSSYNNERIPTAAKLGMSYAFNKKVLACLETEKSSHEKYILKAGVEYKPVDLLIFRLGYRSNAHLLCFGAGFNLKPFSIDIGSLYHPQLGYTIQVGISAHFIPKTNE